MVVFWKTTLETALEVPQCHTREVGHGFTDEQTEA